MKGVCLLLVAACGLVTADTARFRQNASATHGSTRRESDFSAIRQAGGNLSVLVTDLRTGPGQPEAGLGPSAGDLWIEIGRLKRARQQVRSIEWLVSDLEESLRRGPQDATARRHLLNQLEYEIHSLNRRRP